MHHFYVKFKLNSVGIKHSVWLLPTQRKKNPSLHRRWDKEVASDVIYNNIQLFRIWPLIKRYFKYQTKTTSRWRQVSMSELRESLIQTIRSNRKLKKQVTVFMNRSLNYQLTWFVQNTFSFSNVSPLCNARRLDSLDLFRHFCCQNKGKQTILTTLCIKCNSQC